MLKTGNILRNGLRYAIRTIGDGIDIITPHNEFLEEGVASLQEAIKLVEADSTNNKYDHIRDEFMSDKVHWPK